MKRKKGKANKRQEAKGEKQDARSGGQEAQSLSSYGLKPGLHNILSISLILIISIAIYSNTLKNGFVYDDEVTVVNNTLIKNIDNLPKLFSRTDYFATSGEMSYRPVVTLTYFLDYAFYGLKAWGYHLTNLLLHAMNGVILYVFLTLFIHPFQSSIPVLKHNGTSFNLQSSIFNLQLIISLLFITHPVLTEAVNAISFREDGLCFLFFISALILYIKSKMSVFYLLSSVFFYLLALLSKEMAITFPLIIFLYEWIYGKQPPQSPFVKGDYNSINSPLLKGVRGLLFTPHAIGYILITILYLYLRFFLFTNPVEEDLHAWLLSERLMTLPYLLLKYIILLIAPVSLSADYVITPVQSLISLKFIIPIIVIMIILLMVASLFFNLQSSIFNLQSMFGILFLLITLLPVYNLISIANPFAERYLYLPMVGFTIVIGSTFTWFMAHRSLLIVHCSLLIIISIYSFAVIKRNKVWRDELSLWSDVVSKSPDNASGHSNLGVVYEEQGQIDEAIKEYKMALILNPNYAEAHNNLGTVYEKQGQIDEAIKEYRMALTLKPNIAEIHNNLGIIYDNQGRVDEAIKEYLIALKFKPDYARAHNNLGIIYEKQGQIDEAIKEYRMALKLNPDDVIAHYNLDLAYNEKGLKERAIEELEFVLKLKPDYTQARELLGSLKMR